MHVVILAGGLGTRLAEETSSRPKPMVEIGGKPMLWHIMHLYAHHGFRDFLVAAGYRGEVIKEYFRHFFDHHSDFIVDLKDGSVKILHSVPLDWKVGVVDTGKDTQTGGRIRRLQTWIGAQRFMVTYGDGVGDVDLRALAAFHRAHGRLATVTAVRPPSRFGDLDLAGDQVKAFSEKLQARGGWINGGFFVFEPGVFDYLAGDATILEQEPMRRLAADDQLMAYRHEGFWQPVDTLREKQLLERLWDGGQAPWKVWP